MPVLSLRVYNRYYNRPVCIYLRFFLVKQNSKLVLKSEIIYHILL